MRLDKLLFVGALILMAHSASAGEPLDFDKLWDYGDPAATEEEFRGLLPAAEASGDRSYHTQLLTQIARTLGLQRKFAEAHAVLDGVEPLATAELPVVRARYLLERGRLFNSAGEPEKAVPLFKEAWDFGRAQGLDFYAVDAAHMLAIAEPSERQAAWNEKALELAEASGDERARNWLGSLYNNMGMTYLDQRRHEEALAIFEKGWEWRRRRDNAEATRVAKWCVGHALRKLERYEEALELQRELEENSAAAEQPDGFVFEEIGECLLALDREEEARTYFRKAYAQLKEIGWIRESDPGRLERLEKLAQQEED
ncbi:MAG: tetratricopeptide repeat protein [Candidatus Eisenbacteria bacterium]|nr:tetratricopeptide repeat protein [Candidatus Eisenbacteria bacterium]